MQVRHIAFVCGGLGEGRNGVGDYCRRLAQALVPLGVRCDIMALADPDCVDLVEGSIEVAGDGPGSAPRASRPASVPPVAPTSPRRSLAAGNPNG